MHICDITEKIKKIKEVDLFHPILIVIIGHLAIIILALPYWEKIGVYNILKVIGIISIFILGFSFPFIFNLKVKFNEYIVYLSFLLLSFLSIYGVFKITHSLFLSTIYLLFILMIVELFIKFHKKRIFNDILFVIGIVAFILIVFIYGAIPILNYNVRMAINSEPLRLISMGALIYSAIENKVYFIIAFVILVLLGYKVGVLMLFIAYILYKYRNMSFKHMVLIGVGLLIFLGIMGKIILASSNQNWDLNPIELLCYRAYFDLYVLSKIVESNILTLGKITLTPNGEQLIGELLFNYKHNFTTTLFGTIYLDFGIFGVLFAMLFGWISKFIYEGDKKLYAIYASLLLAYCEIGINYGFLIVLCLLLYIDARLKQKDKIKNR
ncbi:MAG: oligosaccharide repeat unit polymerase [Methanocaldococcus sp.]